MLAGHDPQYAKEPWWSKSKKGEDNSIPATESHTGDGPPGYTAGASGEQAPIDGKTAHATQ